MVEVRKVLDDYSFGMFYLPNAPVPGAIINVNETTAIATIAVPFTDAMKIEVVALANENGLTSLPSATQQLLGAEFNLGQAGIVSSPMAYAYKFGSGGTSEGRFNRPYGIAVTTQTSQQYVYVADTFNHRIEIYTINTNTGVATYGQRMGGGDFGSSQGSSQYDFTNPYGIAINPAQTRWAVADTGNHRIKVYNTPTGGDNNLIFGSLGSTDGKFNNPKAVAFDRSGNILVADSTRVQLFSSSGTFISKWATPHGTNDGEIHYPTSIAVNKIGNVIVSGSNGVQMFNATGTFLVKLIAPQGGAFYNANVAVDNKGVGQIIVSDVSNFQIHLYSGGGTYISSFGSSGSGDGEFNEPNGVSIDDDGNVYVCDTKNHRIQILT